MSEHTFTDANFNQDVLQAKGLVVVDFYAPWCGPCKMMAPTIAELSEEFTGRITIGKLDVDENPLIGEKYQIQSIPTIIFFKSGNVVEILNGFQNKEVLKMKMEEHMA